MKKTAIIIQKNNFELIKNFNIEDNTFDIFDIDDFVEFLNIETNKYDYILIDSKVKNLIKHNVLKSANLFASALYLKNNEHTIILVSENRFDEISGFKTKNIGKTGIDTISHSDLSVEKVARIAYEIAENNKLKISNVDNAKTLTSSYIWRKVVNDINEDYPNTYLENILIEEFPIKFISQHKNFELILVDPFYKNIVYNTMLACEYHVINSIFLNETNQKCYIFSKNTIDLINEDIKKNH